MVMRQSGYKDKAFFDDHIQYLDGFRPRALEKISEGIDETHARRLKGDIYSDGMISFISKYTRGDSIHELELEFPKLLHDVKSLLEVEASLAPNENLEQYIECVQLLSLCYFFSAPKEDVISIAEHIPFSGHDKLVDYLIKASISEYAVASHQLMFPDIYQSLVDSIGLVHEPEVYKQKLVSFLEGYYPGLKKYDVTWHDGHLEPDPERCFHFGYWVFELPALLLSTNIFDDSPIRDNTLYPKDMADWKKDQIKHHREFIHSNTSRDDKGE